MNNEERKKFLISLCKVYRGDDSEPESVDEFTQYIFIKEKAIVERSVLPDVQREHKLGNEESAEEYFKIEIQAAIDLSADVPYGGNPKPFYERYFKL